MAADPSGLFTRMRFSRESEYGLAGLRVLARQPAGTIMLLRDIAAAGALPERFLAKIFHKLVRHRVVRSHRGAVRGYSLARAPAAISLREVLEAIEGPGLFDRCVFWPAPCSQPELCCLHEQWAAIRPTFAQALQTTTLERLASTEPGGRS